MRTEETFVIIVGGGPVGLSAALDLGHRGVPTILINENLHEAQHPRCNSTNARSMEHFRRLGIAEEIRNSAPGGKNKPYVAYVTRYCGYELGRLDTTRFRATSNAVTGQFQSAERTLKISQPFLEPAIRKGVERKESVDVRFGWKMVDFKSSNEGVVVTAENISDGARVQIKARYMIAADGARSAARRQFGIKLIGEDGKDGGAFVGGVMMTYFFRAPTLVEESGRPQANLTWILNHDLRAFVFSQDGNDHWIVHYQVPDGQDWEKLDHAGVLRKVFGKDVPYEMISFGPWAGGLALVAERYQAENVFLVGDAAHLFTPLGGLGMNTGIGDAMNISWKLAAMHQGWGGPRLTESFHPERHPIGLRNSRLGVHCSRRKGAWKIPPDVEETGADADKAREEFGAFVVVDDVDEYETSGLQFGERYEGSPIIVRDEEAPVPDTWGAYQAIDYVSARLPDFPIHDNEHTLHDLLGDGFALLVLDDELNPGPFADAAEKVGLPLKMISCRPPEGLFRSKVILVRPDRHIAWHGDDIAPNASDIVNIVRGAG